MASAGGGVANDELGGGEEKASAQTAEKIKDEEKEVRLVQDWWSSDGDDAGPASASRRPMLACVEEKVLAEVIAAGGNYHMVLSADRLDGLHRQHGSGSDPAVEPLRKALQARGGSKAQARAVGMLLFKEARTLREQCAAGGASTPMRLASIATPARSANAAVPPAASAPPLPAATGVGLEVKLDEAYLVPRRFVCSEAYPAGAFMAARLAPSSKSELVAKLPDDFAYLARGRIGEWLEVQVDRNGTLCRAYVLHTIGDQVMLVPAVPAVCLEEAWNPARRWIQAESYPEGAQMAARAAPSRDGKQVATLPHHYEYHATGRSGDYLQIYLDIEGARTAAYVLHTLGDLVLLRPGPGIVSSVVAQLEMQQQQLQQLPQVQQQLQQSLQPQPQQLLVASPQASPRSVAESPQPWERQPTLQQLQQLQEQTQLQLQLQQQRTSEAAAAARAAAEAAHLAARAARDSSDVRVDALEARVSLQERQIQALQSEVQQLRLAFGSAATAFAAAARQPA